MAPASELPAPAATILLLRDEPAFEVLMIARHAAAAFAGGAMVFPGGRVDKADRDPRWRLHAQGLSDEPVRAAAEIAAVRECFEETGVLLARRDGAYASGAFAADLSPRRRDIVKDAAAFFDLIATNGLVVACDAMRLFSHWVAPPGLHRRFDTLFFAARTPPGQAPLEDGDEATEAVWIEPLEAIRARADGRRKIIFPTARNLDLLATSRSVDEAFAFAARRPIPPIEPAAEDRNGRMCLVIPEGLGYPVTEEWLDAAYRG